MCGSWRLKHLPSLTRRRGAFRPRRAAPRPCTLNHCRPPSLVFSTWDSLRRVEAAAAGWPGRYHRSVARCLKPTDLCTHLSIHLALPMSCGCVTNRPRAYELKTTLVYYLAVSGSPGTAGLSPPAQDGHQGQAVISSETGLGEDPKLT